LKHDEHIVVVEAGDIAVDGPLAGEVVDQFKL